MAARTLGTPCTLCGGAVDSLYLRVPSFYLRVHPMSFRRFPCSGGRRLCGGGGAHHAALPQRRPTVQRPAAASREAPAAATHVPCTQVSHWCLMPRRCRIVCPCESFPVNFCFLALSLRGRRRVVTSVDLPLCT